MKDFEDAMDGLAVVAIGVYLAMVLIRGNAKPFLTEVVKETGFVEFVLAIFIVSLILKLPQAAPVRGPIIFATVFILAARIISGSNMAAFSDFAAGRVSLFQFAGNLFQTQK